MTRLARELALRGFYGHRLLTWELVHMLGAVYLIASAGFAYEFVAGCQNDDAKQRNDDVKRGGNMPLAKDDAEVTCIPSEQHLSSRDRTSELHFFLGKGGMPHVHLAHRSVGRHVHRFLTHMLMALHCFEC